MAMNARNLEQIENQKDKGITSLSLGVLHKALATELVCVLRYRFHYFRAKDGRGLPIANEFMEHSNQELAHADRIAERIGQLRGIANFDPAVFNTLSHVDYPRTEINLDKMIEEDLRAEEIAIESYSQAIEELETRDTTTRRLFEDILAEEEGHADEMRSLLQWSRHVVK